MRIAVALMLMIGVLSTVAGGNESSPDYEKNWPQWRGPLATGVAPLGKPPVEWGEVRNIRWKTPLPGLGHSTPVVWGDLVFLLTAIETDKVGEPPKKDEEESREPTRRRRRMVKPPTKIHQFALIAVDRGTGEILWRKVACEELPHEGMHNDGSFASNSPVTDGEHVFAYFGSRGLFCYDMKGKLVWKKDLGDMTVKMSFGEGSSPVLYRDKVIVNWDHEGPSFVTVLDKKTGKPVWTKERDEETSWSTPLVVEHEGKPQLITSATNRVRSYDLATGKVLWEVGGMTANVIPCPVAADGLVHVMSGFRGSALLTIRLDKALGDLSGSEAVVWNHEGNTPYVPSPLLYENTLYFLRGNEGDLSCFDARTGKPHFERKELEGIRGVYSSPVGADGRVYLTGRNGVTLVLEQGPEYKVLASNRLDDSFTASAAIVGEELFLRGHQRLYCIKK